MEQITASMLVMTCAGPILVGGVYPVALAVANRHPATKAVAVAAWVFASAALWTAVHWFMLSSNGRAAQGFADHLQGLASNPGLLLGALVEMLPAIAAAHLGASTPTAFWKARGAMISLGACMLALQIDPVLFKNLVRSSGGYLIAAKYGLLGAGVAFIASTGCRLVLDFATRAKPAGAR